MSNIDLSLSNSSLAQRLEWNVYKNITSSDHFPIIIKYIPRTIDPTPNKRWNLKKPDWSLFSNLLEEEIKSIKDTETLNIDTLVNTLTNSIIQIANLTIGKSTAKNRKPKVPWWKNKNIKSAIQDKYKELKQFQFSKTQEDFIELKKT